jgi:hypothetical protein
VEGRGVSRSSRWVLTPSVLKLFKGEGGDSMGHWIDEGRGRGGAAAQLFTCMGG